MLSPAELAGYEAVQLFLTRARAHRPAFALTAANAAAVTQVCTRLEGLPLALELAAARLGALSVQEVAARLDDRFALLSVGSRTALPRQQTLRATLDWSWTLLSAAEQRLLRRLSTFAGGWTLAAAEDVCAGDGTGTVEMGSTGERIAPTPEAVLDLLAGLVSKSLVQVAEHEGQSRYGLLETVRQYALERMELGGEIATVRGRHTAWYLRLAEAAAAALQGARQGEWLARLEAEHDNLRAALRWSLDGGDPATTLRLVGALGWFWLRHSHYTEGRAWLEEALALAVSSTRTLLSRPRSSPGASRRR